MNFRIIENGPSSWDKEDELIQQYRDGVPVAEIRENLSISSPTFNKMIQQFKKEGKNNPKTQTLQVKEKSQKKTKILC